MNRWAASALASVALLVAGTGSARAHAIGAERFEPPLPLLAVLAVGGLAVAGTSIGLALRTPGRTRATRPATIGLPPIAGRAGRTGLRLAAVVAVVSAVGIGLVGGPPRTNPAPTVIWAIGLHGVAIIAILTGNPWPTLSPWRTVYAGLCRLEGDVLAFRPYPAWLGTWPALVGVIGGVGVVGTLTVVPRLPGLTAIAVTLYGGTMIAGAIIFGPTWLERGDPLAVIYDLLGRVAPLHLPWEPGETAMARRPAGDPVEPLETLGTVSVAVTLAYTIAFDGFVGTQLFTDVVGLIGDRDQAGVVLYVAGGLVVVGCFGLVVRQTVGPVSDGVHRDRIAVAGRLGSVVLPVAAAVELAHATPLVLQSIAGLLGTEDPLAIVPGPLLWVTLIVLVLGGHLLAVRTLHRILAERDRNADPPSGGVPRAVWPMTVFLVGSVVASLWVVSRPLLL